VLGSSAGELSGTSNFAKERLIRRQGARASAATGKELKARTLAPASANFLATCGNWERIERQSLHRLHHLPWNRSEVGGNWERIESNRLTIIEMQKPERQLGKN
jgi:hypothetical protein